MSEHRPWVGRLFDDGIDGQRIAIVGHSHHQETPDVDEGMTEGLVSRIVEKTQKAPHFFTCVRNYFGHSSHADFWPRVIFFNFLPDHIGNHARKYAHGSLDQLNRGKDRFNRILLKHCPHKVIVFSNSPGKGWETLPPSLEQDQGIESGDFPLGPDFPSTFRQCTYMSGGRHVLAFGLRHTQGANGEIMRRAIRRIMDIPVTATDGTLSPSQN